MTMFGVGSAGWWATETRYDAATGCVLYMKPRPDGYKQVKWNGRLVLVHRLAYQQVHGPIERGMVICHRCDTPNCVNPAHLFAGTQKDNLRDMFRKGRARPQGKATPALTVFPAVSGRVARRRAKSPALEKAHAAGVSWDTIHLPRTILVPSNPGASFPVAEQATDAPGSRWYHVAGVPKVQPAQALVKWERPLSWTERYEAGVKTGLEMSRQCEPVSPYCAPVPTSQAAS